MESQNKIPRQKDYLTLIDKVIREHYEKYNPIIIDGEPVPVRFVNSNRIGLWLSNVQRNVAVGKNKGDIPTPSIIINREENSEIFSNFNQPWVGTKYSRVMVETTKKRASEAVEAFDDVPVKEYVWIQKPKPIKLVYTISCYSKFNLHINEFYAQMLDRMNATNITIDNVPNNLDLRFFFENKMSSKDNKNTSNERYILATFTLNVDGFAFNLNDVRRDTGIETVITKFVETES